MINVTENAVKHLRALLEEQPDAGGKKGRGLRIFVEAGGCAGMQYGMKIDRQLDGDEVIESGGVQVLVDAASVDYLRGATIDFADELAGAGFRIQNPNAARSCGCGTSFERA